MVRRANRRDANHSKIVKELRQIPGISVADTGDLGNGFPDIVVGYKGKNLMIEIKDGEKPPSGRKLTPDEKEFHDTWRGQVCIATCTNDVFDLIKLENV